MLRSREGRRSVEGHWHLPQGAPKPYDEVSSRVSGPPDVISSTKSTTKYTLKILDTSHMHARTHTDANMSLIKNLLHLHTYSKDRYNKVYKQSIMYKIHKKAYV